MDYYWQLTLKDGTTVDIPPKSVEAVQALIKAGKPIHTKSAVIPANFVSIFRQTSNPYGNTKLIDDVARVFNEQELNEDGSIVSRWVKKEVTHEQYQRYYSQILGYKKLEDKDNMAVVAFMLPIHTIDLAKVSYCTPYEEESLERKRAKSH